MGPKCNHKGPFKEAAEDQSEGDVGCEDRHRAEKRGGARPLALKPEGGATSQGIQAAPRSCASRKRIPSQRLQKEPALPTLDCSSVRPTSEV